MNRECFILWSKKSFMSFETLAALALRMKDFFITRLHHQGFFVMAPQSKMW